MRFLCVSTVVQCLVGLVMVGGGLWGVHLAAAPAQTPSVAPGLDIQPVLVTLLQLHNQQREQAGLPPLTAATRLMQAAQVQAQYMATHTRTTHEGPDGTTAAQRVTRQGYDYLKVGENVAGGPETPEAVVQGWMHSPPHRQNILGSFHDIGAARATAADGRQYWCVVFATPLRTLDSDRATAQVVALLNQKRSAASLPPLQVAPALTRAAQEQAQALAAGTARQDQANLQQLLQRAGYHYRKISLGTVSGAPSPQAVLQGFTEAPAYKHQLLGDFTQVGVGYATADDGMPYWSILFGVPQS